MTVGRLLRGNWLELGQLAATVRRRVFIEEQGIAVEHEWDSLDQTSRHLVIVTDYDAPIGTARLTPNAHIGRMAVLPAWHRPAIAPGRAGGRHRSRDAHRGFGRAIARNRILREASVRSLRRDFSGRRYTASDDAASACGSRAVIRAQRQAELR